MIAHELTHVVQQGGAGNADKQQPSSEQITRMPVPTLQREYDAVDLIAYDKETYQYLKDLGLTKEAISDAMSLMQNNEQAKTSAYKTLLNSPPHSLNLKGGKIISAKSAIKKYLAKAGSVKKSQKDVFEAAATDAQGKTSKRLPKNGTKVPHKEIGKYWLKVGGEAGMTAEKLVKEYKLGAFPSYWAVQASGPIRLFRDNKNTGVLRPVMLVSDVVKNATKGVELGKTVYRGDGRGPYQGYGRNSDTWQDSKKGVLETGYKSWGKNQDLYLHADGSTNMDSDNPAGLYVSTSTQSQTALNFAGHPPHNTGWVYKMKIKAGINVNTLLGGISPHTEEKELSVPYEIPQSDILKFKDPYPGDDENKKGWKKVEDRFKQASFDPGSEIQEFRLFVDLYKEQNVEAKSAMLDKAGIIKLLLEKQQKPDKPDNVEKPGNEVMSYEQKVKLFEKDLKDAEADLAKNQVPKKLKGIGKGRLNSIIAKFGGKAKAKKKGKK